MATEKKITSRIQQKHDVAANWAKATNFIPKKGEIIIYDAEYNASGEETQAVRFKIGDGSKTVNNLPFAVIDYSSDIETLEQKVANNSTAIGALQENTVPKTRKINNKALSSDITLGAADVGVTETAFPGLKKTGTVTGVKMNGTTKNPSSGVVDLGTVITAHQSIKSINTNNTAAQTVNASEAIAGSGTINLHKIAKTGSYNDLSNKPTFVSSVNGSSGVITNVAKTDETNVFTKSQIILKPSDETQASLWNYSGCIGYSHWVQGSPSEPRIGIGYKNSGIRVFNGTTETPAQYYDVTMPSQAGQLVTDTFAKFTGETSGVANPYRVFPNEETYAAYKSTSPGTPLDFQYTSQTYSTFIANTDANSRTALTDGRIVNKKNGTNYELILPTKTGTLALTSDISGKLDKTTYEWNKEFRASRNGAISLGRYNIYDTQLTFDISSTTSISMNGKLVIATQNGRICQAKVFGDATGVLVSKIVIYQSAIVNNRSWIEIFCNFDGWSKNKVHIYGVALESATVTNQMSSVTFTNGVPSPITSGDSKWSGTIDNDLSVKQNKLTAGSNISISGNTISATVPTVNNGTLTIQKNGTKVATFTANQSSSVTANIIVPTKVSQLQNDSGYTTNKGTVTSVAIKMNGSEKGKVTSSGTIDLGTVLTAMPQLKWVTPTSVDEIKSAILWKVTDEKSADKHGGIEIAIGSGQIGNGSGYNKYNSANYYGLCNVNIISDSQTFVELIPFTRSVPNQQYRTNIVLSDWKILKLG